MEIRRLTEEDAEEYRAIRLRGLHDHPEAFGSSYEDSLNLPLSVTIERLRQENLPDSLNFMLGAFEQGRLVGTLGFRRLPGSKLAHRADIVAVYVAPEMRGKGLGRALLQNVIALARQMVGLEQLLLTVTTTNSAARQLYRNQGFEVYALDRRCLKLGNQYLDEELMVLHLI